MVVRIMTASGIHPKGKVDRPTYYTGGRSNLGVMLCDAFPDSKTGLLDTVQDQDNTHLDPQDNSTEKR